MKKIITTLLISFSYLAISQNNSNITPTPKKREIALKKLLKRYIKEGMITDAELLIQTETSLELRKLKVAHALNKKDFSNCQAELDSIPNDTIEENIRFKQLYQELVNICGSGRKLTEITISERGVIEQVAHSATSSRVVAESILAQLDNRQYIRVPENPSTTPLPKPNNPNQPNNRVNNFDLVVYPNPTSNNFTINYRFSKEESNKEVLLTDLVGGRILSKIPIENEYGAIIININTIANGTYLIHLIENGTIIKSEKAIILK